ncbi:MAG: CPBP family intramembrane metalloprotease [Leptospirales bacterium]|nr:CPBP family intramembrane metalloprotease [Leptospirales bacterium]
MDSLAYLLTDYLPRILPGLLLIGLTLSLVPLRYWRFHLALHIVLFILIRDSMTPAGFWSLGREGGFWLRLDAGPLALIALGLGAVGLTLASNRLEAPMRERLVYLRGNRVLALAIGLGGAALIVSPFLFLYSGVAPEARGGAVSLERLPYLFFFALCGAFYEETLFRGYLQGWIEVDLSPLRGVAVSTVTFAIAHLFLAYTVTDVGWPVVLFGLFEGAVCAVVRWRSGLLASTLSHGLATFLLSFGLFSLS